MSYLLDCVHEDLNRVKKKPYTKAVEGGDGRPDSEIAAETWATHLQRNDSVVVDHCQVCIVQINPVRLVTHRALLVGFAAFTSCVSKVRSRKHHIRPVHECVPPHPHI